MRCISTYGKFFIIYNYYIIIFFTVYFDMVNLSEFLAGTGIMGNRSYTNVSIDVGRNSSCALSQRERQST